MLLHGDLDIITTPDIWEGSGSSWNANVGTTGFGGGVGEITEDMNWTDTASGMWFTEGADIDVDGKTYLEGGAIVSEADGGLSLSTGELEVADLAINDYADDSYVGGQVNVNLGNVITGEGDAFTENKYGTVEYESVGHEKEGSINSTLSGLGELTIGGEEQDLAKLDDLGINTDADNIITITKDESWEESFKIDLVNVGVAAEQVDNLVNVVESFTAKVPDHVKAMGPNAEDVYRRAIANGKGGDSLDSFVQTPEFDSLVRLRTNLVNDYENGTASAERIYQHLDLELKAMADAFRQENCQSSSLVQDVCGRIAGYFNKDVENLTNADVVEMLGLLESMYLPSAAGSEWQQQMIKAAIECGVVLSQTTGDKSVVHSWLQDEERKDAVFEATADVANYLSPSYVYKEGGTQDFYDSVSGFADLLLDPVYQEEYQDYLLNRDSSLGRFSNVEELTHWATAVSIFKDGVVSPEEQQKLETLASYYEDKKAWASSSPLTGLDNVFQGDGLKDHYNKSLHVYGNLANGDFYADERSEMASQLLSNHLYDLDEGSVLADSIAATITGYPLASRFGSMMTPKTKIKYDDLWKSATKTNQQGTSALVRAIDKHSGREGSVYQKLKGNQANKNAEAEKLLNEIMNDSNKTITAKQDQRTLKQFGSPVIDIVSSDGRGLRFSADGKKFIGLLEPKTK